MNQADLESIGAQALIDLHLENWRVAFSFVVDLCAPDGREVYALCYPEKDSKRASIQLRDPSTPPTGMTSEQWEIAIRTAVYHEVDHLHFAAFDTQSPAERTAEENAVWGTTFALESAWKVPADCRLAAIGPKTSAPSRRARQHRRSIMADTKEDPKTATAGDKSKLLEIIANGDEKAALEWVKAYVAAELNEGPASEPAPGAPTAAAPGGDDTKPPAPGGAPMAARSARALAEIEASAASGRSSALRLAISTARTADGIDLPPAVEKRILASRTLAEGEAILSTARDMAAIGKPREGRSGAQQNGKEGDTSAAGDTTGLARHEIDAYESIKKSDPAAGAAYLKEAKAVHARSARTLARTNAKKDR